MNSTILAVDCSQRVTTILVSRGPVVFERQFDPAAVRDREPIWDELKELCDEAHVEPWQFDAVGVTTGPGGFTGLRVSIAFAKAFALARGIPVVALGSATVFAASDAVRGGQGQNKGPWLVALASKAGTAWCARVTRDGGAVFVEEAGEVVDAVAFMPKVSAVAAAGGAVLSDEHLDPALLEVVRRSDARLRPIATDPCGFALLVQLAFSRKATVDPMVLAPIYPREPEAVTKWRERHAPKP